MTSALVRRTDRKMIAGVCSGIADRFGWSTGLVRILFVLSLLIPGPQVLLYIGLWILMPKSR